MAKIDLEKLLCSLTNIEITGTYLASCFQDALREQGLVCDDGKIKSLDIPIQEEDEKEETRVTITETVNNKNFGVEIIGGNYYRCIETIPSGISSKNIFTEGEIYYSPSDWHLMNDNNDVIEWGDRTLNFELVNPEEMMPSHRYGIKGGNYYECTEILPNYNFLKGRIYWSPKDNVLLDNGVNEVSVEHIARFFKFDSVGTYNVTEEKEPEKEYTVDVEEMFQDYLKELGDDYTFNKAEGYRRGILDTLKKLSIQQD